MERRKLTRIILNKTNDFTLPEIKLSVERGLNSLDLDLDFRSVIIKPNLCYYWDYTTGQTTDPRVVAAIIDWIRTRRNDSQIIIGETDASAMKTKYSFKILGYEALASQKKVQLVNLSKGDIVNKQVSVRDEKIKLPVNKLLLNADVIINVPTLKTHREIGFTCAMKNVFGLISKPWKYSFHNKLSEIIVAINKIIKSNIVVVDGIIASGKTPKKMGAIITGKDAYSVDVIVSDLVGYGSTKVPYLKLAKNEGFGTAGKIELVEQTVKLSELKKDFPKYNYFIDRLLWKSELKALKLYIKLVGDILPPVLEKV